MTPMAAAAKRGHTEIVHLLLQARGDPNIKNKVSDSMMNKTTTTKYMY